jgi:ribosomal protein L7Ae-like RNA K-turn-binding protein
VNEQKLTGMIGLAIRSGQTAAGMDASRIMIRSGQCGVLLLDSDIGPNSRKKAGDLCRTTGTPMMLLPPGMIEKATGKSNMVISVRKGSFAEQLLKMNESLPVHSSETEM